MEKYSYDLWKRKGIVLLSYSKPDYRDISLVPQAFHKMYRNPLLSVYKKRLSIRSYYERSKGTHFIIHI